MSLSSEPKKLTPEDVPSKEDQDKLRDSVRSLLNPDGSNERMDGYINSTFSYVQNALDKVAHAEDKDAASKEIANDIVQKFKVWAESFQQGQSNTNASSDAGDASNAGAAGAASAEEKKD